VIASQLDSCLERRTPRLSFREDLHHHSQHLIWAELHQRLLAPQNRNYRCVDRGIFVYHHRRHDAGVHAVISREIWNAAYGDVSGDPDYLLENSSCSYSFRVSFYFLNGLCLRYSFDHLLGKRKGSSRVLLLLLLYLVVSDFGVKAVRFAGTVGAPSDDLLGVAVDWTFAPNDAYKSLSDSSLYVRLCSRD
jgi:hypothetical protein